MREELKKDNEQLLELEVGKTYISQNYEMVKIEKEAPSNSGDTYPFKGDNGVWYTKYGGGQFNCNLVSEFVNPPISDMYKGTYNIGISDDRLPHKFPNGLYCEHDSIQQEKSIEVRRFPSGAIRSSDKGRLRPDYISPYALEELSAHFTKAEKDFGSDEDATNYWKGIRPIDVKSSISRHYLDLQKAFYPYNSENIREELRALACNCIMALHQIRIEELGLYKEPYEKTEYITKDN